MWQAGGPLLGPTDPNPEVNRVEAEYRAKRGFTRSNLLFAIVELAWLLLVSVFKLLRFLVRQPIKWWRLRTSRQ